MMKLKYNALQFKDIKMSQMRIIIVTSYALKAESLQIQGHLFMMKLQYVQCMGQTVREV